MSYSPQPGDVVMLKSGGPEMTVSFVTGYGEVYCQWFLENKELRDKAFQPESLMKIIND